MAAYGALLLVPAVAQDRGYHHFSDCRKIASVPNFYNVISNFLFLIFGSVGLFITLYLRERTTKDLMLPANLSFFTGIFLTGIGSSYYHLDPSLDTLVWDRLPMTITFMAFFSIIISEHIDLVAGRKFLPHLLFLGIMSVVYWYKTEQNGQGDLRPYILVQFLPLLLIPIILLLFRSESQFAFYYWCMLLVYALAKTFECFDAEVFSCAKIISGHSLKHLFASLTPLIYLLKLWNQMVLNRV